MFILCYILLNNRSQGQKEEGGIIVTYIVCLPKESLYTRKPAFLEMTRYLPAYGKYGIKSSSSFCFTYYMLSSTHMSSHLPSIFYASHRRGEWVSSCVAVWLVVKDIPPQVLRTAVRIQSWTRSSSPRGRPNQPLDSIWNFRLWKKPTFSKNFRWRERQYFSK